MYISNRMSSVELCAGGGGQALGLESAGFDHEAVVEIEPSACNTLRLNRPNWSVVEGDVREFDGRPFRGVELLAAGLPCPPFSRAGQQLGADDERDLFPTALRLVDEIRPRAVLIENVRGFLDSAFDDYRNEFRSNLERLGYVVDWKLFNAAEFGVSQARYRVALVALASDLASDFSWPEPLKSRPVTVGSLLHDLMAADDWQGVDEWRQGANKVAPTIVGGSHKHGGPDLGPTRAKKGWAELGVDGKGIADAPPARDFVGMPRLTNRMVARIQGFPDEWGFWGRKTATYRQVGNAFPPPLAQAVGAQIAQCLGSSGVSKVA